MNAVNANENPTRFKSGMKKVGKILGLRGSKNAANESRAHFGESQGSSL